MTPGSVVALVGAQYGSEGKGAIAAKIALDFHVHIRTGAPNAGHTYYIDRPNILSGNAPLGPEETYADNRLKVVARSVPVGVKNPNAHLVIGPGGMIDLDLLLAEVAELDRLGLDPASRLLVDEKAIMIDRLRHHDYEGGIRGQAHEKIGSTGEGVGIARMGHLARGVLAKDAAWGHVDHAGDPAIRELLDGFGIHVADTVPIVNSWIDAGQNVLLEGTQGSGLSSVHGPWPYCTSTDTNAGQLCVDAGISPLRLNSTILVARTFPIRVAGNSGPLEYETSWMDIGVPSETTTVTKKVRRVGWWDDKLLKRAILLNGPDTHLAITFIDYIDSEMRGVEEWDKMTRLASSWLWGIEQDHDNHIIFVGTGPDSVMVAPRSKWGKQ